MPLLIALLWTLPLLSAQAPAARPGEAAFRELYRELIEINTTLSSGSCTAAAEAMAARLKAAGLPPADIQVLVPPDRPKDGNLIATMRGRDPQARPILLLAHLDVVEAKREDWVRDLRQSKRLTTAAHAHFVRLSPQYHNANRRASRTSTIRAAGSVAMSPPRRSFDTVCT